MYQVEASIHKQLKNGSYRVKVSILHPELLMYINGMVVFEPDNAKYTDWVVFTPTQFHARIVEFAKDSQLWQEIQIACVHAVDNKI